MKVPVFPTSMWLTSDQDYCQFLLYSDLRNSVSSSVICDDSQIEGTFAKDKGLKINRNSFLPKILGLLSNNNKYLLTSQLKKEMKQDATKMSLPLCAGEGGLQYALCPLHQIALCCSGSSTLI